MLVFNAHIHLNGSVSSEYLQTTARRNNCVEIYSQFESESNLWKKFGFIHQIMQTSEDILLAVVDVVKNSNADVLEIRTTPKATNKCSIEDYIQGFIEGIKCAKEQYPEKEVKGLLSIDRSRHSLEDAKWIIDTALKEKQQNGTIVGVDLSGNFLGNRTLTGINLYQAVKYALEKDIGVALHVGEIDSEIERADFDLILKAIKEYGGKIYGKVRLGHAIYRTSEQDKIISQLKIPVEICPSCHEKLDWWKQGEAHPILTLYQYRSQVLPGTDNSLLFECNEQEEQKKLDAFLKIPEKDMGLSEAELDEKIASKRRRYMF